MDIKFPPWISKDFQGIAPMSDGVLQADSRGSCSITVISTADGLSFIVGSDSRFWQSQITELGAFSQRIIQIVSRMSALFPDCTRTRDSDNKPTTPSCESGDLRSPLVARS